MHKSALKCAIFLQKIQKMGCLPYSYSDPSWEGKSLSTPTLLGSQSPQLMPQNDNSTKSYQILVCFCIV